MSGTKLGASAGWDLTLFKCTLYYIQQALKDKTAEKNFDNDLRLQSQRIQTARNLGGREVYDVVPFIQ